ncbi:MAG: acyltransferase [Bacteroidetes bacterium]|nr:acyltransferase [Bacteroidota bacterium]
MEEKKFDALTVIRALAAFMVFFHHNNMFTQKTFGAFIHNFVNEFHVGVTVFFVLSGFLIYYRYYNIISTTINKKNWLLKYMRNRVARIYPMYFLLTTVTFVYFYLYNELPQHFIREYILNISFIRGFFTDYAFTGIPQGWSLTVEECFYFLTPLIILFSNKIKTIYIFFFFFLFGFLMVLLFRNSDFYGFFGTYKFMLSYTFFGRCFEFFIGIMLAKKMLKIKNENIMETKHGFKNTLIGLLWIIVSISLLILVKGNEKYGVFTMKGILINNFLLPIGIAILFYGLIKERTIIRTLLSTKLMMLLGKSSYIFYLIHMGFISFWLSDLFNNTIISFILLNIFSVALHLFIEEPCNNLIRKIKFQTTH